MIASSADASDSLQLPPDELLVIICAKHDYYC